MNNYDGDDKRTPMKEPWHLDRRIPISLLVALFLQTGTIFYWGGKVESRVTFLENQSPTIVMTKEESDTSHELLQVQIDANNETNKEIKESLGKMDSKLDRLIERDK